MIFSPPTRRAWPCAPVGGGYLCLKETGVSFPSEKIICPRCISRMKILICRHVIRHETSRQDMTCADRSIVIRFFLLLFATGKRLGTVRDCLIW